MLEHGGHLLTYSQRYQLPIERWLDLSTGVSPFAYPCPQIPISAWNCLPELNDGLEQAAAKYYGNSDLLAVAGSQAAIMALPEIIALQRGKLGVVALPRVGYKEHQHAWQSHCDSAGERWDIIFYDDQPDAAMLALLDVLVVINPNNPSALKIPLVQLQQWQMQLHSRNALLIIDEAFIDCEPTQSILRHNLGGNTIILRSLGKFFGLAGARVGFVFGSAQWLNAMAEKLGPWTISGASRWVAQIALQDTHWQQKTRQRLALASLRLQTLLRYYFCGNVSGTDLFQTVQIENASVLHDLLCQQAILTRLCDEKEALRFGLPGSESQWCLLNAVLANLTQLPELKEQKMNHQRGKIELVLGGARSGKSSYAERQAHASGLPVKYIATAAVLDDEMAQRVIRHQQQRPVHWVVIEEPLALAEMIQTHSAPDCCLLVDCLTLWLSNSLFSEPMLDWESIKAQLLEALTLAQGPVILVSNEVGQGIVPMGAISRRFVDEAGWLHQAIAAQADRVVFVTAGLVQLLKDDNNSNA